ncbi:MAG: hypothetical protein KAH54_09090 [Candidatus Sabulitectum sp.]|nr:hypothetical protein [Candidatus Sabulitectum sp.]
MPSKLSFIFILALGAGLLMVAAYFISDASTSKTIIEESRSMGHQTIEHLRNEHPDAYNSRRLDMDGRYDAQLNTNMLYKEAGGWGAGILGVLLFMLGVIDFRLYRLRYHLFQKGILAMLVERHIDALTEKRKNESAEKWDFEKSVFVENNFARENAGKLIFSKEEVSEIIDQIMDGTLK